MNWLRVLTWADHDWTPMRRCAAGLACPAWTSCGASSAMMRRSDSPTPYVARHPLGWRADFTENLVRQRNSSYSHGITKQSRQGRDGYPDTYAHPRGIEPGDAPRPRVGRLEYQPRRLCT